MRNFVFFSCENDNSHSVIKCVTKMYLFISIASIYLHFSNWEKVKYPRLKIIMHVITHVCVCNGCALCRWKIKSHVQIDKKKQQKNCGVSAFHFNTWITPNVRSIVCLHLTLHFVMCHSHTYTKCPIAQNAIQFVSLFIFFSFISMFDFFLRFHL